MSSTCALPDRSVTGEKVSDRRGQLSWALFEFGRSPYLSLVYIFVFPPYFAATVVGDPVAGQQLWSLSNTIGGACVALLAPLLGAIADRTGARKPWLGSIATGIALACFSLWFAMPGANGGLPLWAIVSIIAALVALFQFTEVFHNAILPSIVGTERIGKLSGLGIATGNLGTLIALGIMLFAVALPASGITLGGWLPAKPLFGLNVGLHEHERIAGPVAALWLLIFMTPLLLWTPDRANTGVPIGRAVRTGLQQLLITLKQVRRESNVGWFLIARMLYTDGKTAILAYTGIYAVGVFDWQLTQLLLFAILLTPFSIVGGFIGGWLDAQIGTKRAIQIAILATCACMAAAVSITRETVLFIPVAASSVQVRGPLASFGSLQELAYIAVVSLLAVSITAAFSLSRTLMARISPPAMMNQFFGLYALSGTATAFLGHAVVGFFTRFSGNQRMGFASTVLLLIAGWLVLLKVRDHRIEAGGAETGVARRSRARKRRACREY